MGAKTRAGRAMTRTLGALALVAVVAGCSAQYRNHGYVPSEEDLGQIVVGVDTRDTVAEAVGSPSTASLVDESGYYYVKTRVRHFAYQAPQVINREVVAVTFDSTGVVQNIQRFGLEKGRTVVLQRRVTETNVSGNNFLRKLLNSLGRFRASDILS